MDFFFLKKEKKKPQSIFTSQRRSGVCHFCSAFVSSISHPRTVTSFHPSQQNAAAFLTMINCLNSISDGDAVPRKHHWGRACNVYTPNSGEVMQMKRCAGRKKSSEESDEMEIGATKEDSDANYAETAFEWSQLHGRAHKLLVGGDSEGRSEL